MKTQPKSAANAAPNAPASCSAGNRPWERAEYETRTAFRKRMHVRADSGHEGVPLGAFQTGSLRGGPLGVSAATLPPFLDVAPIVDRILIGKTDGTPEVRIRLTDPGLLGAELRVAATPQGVSILVLAAEANVVALQPVALRLARALAKRGIKVKESQVMANKEAPVSPDARTPHDYATL